MFTGTTSQDQGGKGERAMSSLSLLLPGAPVDYSFDFGVTDMLVASEVSDDDNKSDNSLFSRKTTSLLIGKRASLQKLNAPALLGLSVDRTTVTTMLESIANQKSGGTVATFVGRHRLVLASLPDTVTRNNHPLSVHTITQHVQTAIPKANNPNEVTRILFCGSEMLEHRGALVSALAKAFPRYSQKTSSTTTPSGEDKNDDKLSIKIKVAFINDEGQLVVPPDTSTLTAVMEGVQLAAHLVDATPDELPTTVYADLCRRLAAQLDNVTITEIVGDELREQGYGGLYGVGKAATSPPRLLILDYNPKTNSNSIDETIALVGKGIIYDTGGLSLKSKTGMCGMKHDMAGSAGLLGGFYTAVRSGKIRHKRVVLILCLAENAIGPAAFRNDDILTLYSGKSVEINNCDAEGRLVLGDGVAHATRHVHPLDLVVDMATLTGAQLIATGKRHAGILANTHSVEQRGVEAGRRSGDLVFPLLYAPELLRREFDSTVADMKNSVQDRNNAQSSCAGHFIESHLHPDYQGGWLHVDMAGPATHKERGTGYGVGFVLALLQVPGF